MQKYNFSTMKYLDEYYGDLKRQYEFKAETERQARAWQSALRKKVAELAGGFPKTKCALNPTIIEKEELPNFTREKVVITSEKGIDVPMYVLIPKNSKPPFRCVICSHGHGSHGPMPVVGLIDESELTPGMEEYHRQFGAEFAKRGFMVFAPEHRAFGERREEEDKKAGIGASCRQTSFKAMMMGKTMIGMRVWDIMRVVDYIETLKNADPNRIAVAGISGGGMVTTFACALETRIKAGVISGYFNTFFDSIMSILHCECNYMPNLVKYAEMYEVAGLFAPKPLIVESGIKDNIFPVKATKYAFGKLKQIYKIFGAEKRIDIDVFNDTHRWSGAKSYNFIKKWL